LPEVSLLVSEFNAATLADLRGLRPKLAGFSVPDILDPIGQGAAVFEQVGKQISELVPHVLEICRRPSPRSAE
jgi:hypothetical protein